MDRHPVTGQGSLQIGFERHGGFGEELAEIMKLEAVQGVDFTWETAHSQILHELTWQERLASQKLESGHHFLGVFYLVR